MKTAAKVFIIIGIVFGFLMLIGSIVMLSSNIPGFGVALLIFNIVTLVVGFMSLSKLEDATQKSELTGTAICCLLFCNLVAGILMLCLKDEDLKDNKKLYDNKYIDDSVKEGATIDPTCMPGYNRYNTPTVNNEDYENDHEKNITQSQSNPLLSTNAVIEKLKQLKELKDNEIITDEEFTKLKSELLKKL